MQNPRCVYKPIKRVYWPRIAVQLYFPGQYLLLRRLAAACIGWGKAEPAIRPSRTILHDALNGQNCYIAAYIAYVVMHSPYNDRRGWVTHETICMRTIIIDGLGHETCPRRCRFLDPERRLFSENATLFFER